MGTSSVFHSAAITSHHLIITTAFTLTLVVVVAVINIIFLVCYALLGTWLYSKDWSHWCCICIRCCPLFKRYNDGIKCNSSSVVKCWSADMTYPYILGATVYRCVQPSEPHQIQYLNRYHHHNHHHHRTAIQTSTSPPIKRSSALMAPIVVVLLALLALRL